MSSLFLSAVLIALRSAPDLMHRRDSVIQDAGQHPTISRLQNAAFTLVSDIGACHPRTGLDAHRRCGIIEMRPIY